MKLKSVGLITIGQAPRLDVVPEMADVLSGIEIIEAGALDGLSLQEVRKLAPQAGDHTLVTKMADGTTVLLAKRHADRLVQEQIRKLESKVAAILIICTGEFPELSSQVPLLKTQPILHHTVKAIAPAKVGVIIPEPEQLEMCQDMWKASGLDPVAVAGSPYGDESLLIAAAQALAEQPDVELIVMDCIGFTKKMKQLVQDITNKPVILPRTLVARILAELA
jgi:protein AroM